MSKFDNEYDNEWNTFGEEEKQECEHEFERISWGESKCKKCPYTISSNAPSPSVKVVYQAPKPIAPPVIHPKLTTQNFKP